MGVSRCSTSKLGICSPGFLDPNFPPAQWEGAGGAGGAQSCSSALAPGFGAAHSKPGFGKSTLVAAGHSREG